MPWWALQLAEIGANKSVLTIKGYLTHKERAVMPNNNENKKAFVTCDLLDAHPDSQVCLPNIEGKSFQNFGGKDHFYGEIVTVKCFEDNS